MIKIAFIGAGYMCEEHMKCFSDIDQIEIIGIYSKTINKAKKLISQYNKEGNTYNSIKELYENTKADLVVISVPELATKEICLEAFNYPWICLVEKPVGYNYEESIIIAKEARIKNRIVFVALNRRMYSSTQIILDQITNSNEQRLIHVYDQEDTNAALLSGQPELVVKNWMFANSIHMVDYFSFLGRGEITSIEPIIKWNSGKSPFVMTKIYYNSGDIGIYEAIWNAPGPWAVTITTKSKRWELRPLEKSYTQAYGSRSSRMNEESEWDTKFKPGLRLQAEECIKAIVGKRNKLVNIHEAFKTMDLIDKIYNRNT